MGTILIASCPCGFKPKPIYAGGGMMERFRYICQAPAACLKCKRLLVLNYWDDDVKCPKCGSDDWRGNPMVGHLCYD